MRYLLIFIATIILIPIVCFNLYVLCSGKTFIYRALYYNFVNIDDYKIFENRKIQASPHPQQWPLAKTYNSYKISSSLQDTLATTSSVAFLVIHNDSIQMESYWDGYKNTSLSNSFSMAKSVVSMLIGVAIKDGKIRSVDQLVADFLPEFKEGRKSKITIRHLLMMSSGLNWDESNSYSNLVSVFFSDIMEGYYGSDLYRLCTTTEVAEEPGVYFDYKSGDTQLLAFVLKAATGESLSAYFQRKIWQPIGAQTDALWCLDKENGDEKAFCCLNSNARDFAKLGKLYLNKGWANGTQIIDTGYVKESSAPNMLLDKENPAQKADYYGYQIWSIMKYKGYNITYFRGTLGQLIIIIPEKNLIIVRLGQSQGAKEGNHYRQTLTYIDEVTKIFN